MDEEQLWYKDAIIYELHIKAFKDSNGDGIGDFDGLLEKLDYLQFLGATALWLLPFYPSPLKDDGYDISDYYSINPAYGNIRSFRKLIKEAHKRNIRVITELVLNHTSDQHPWFQRARNAKRNSVFRDYYVWSEDPHKYKDTRIIFQDFETSNWSWDPVAKAYFWHRFYSHQPDLNYDNPSVQKEVFKIIDYWLDMGVDGFRIDAVPYLFERENTNCENLPETHEFLKKLRSHIDTNFKNKVLLAEANMWPEDASSYFGNGDECHMNFHFPIMPRMFMSVKMENRHPIIDIFDQTPDIPETCQWATFLRNHDELTLEMVTDEERDYMYKVYSKDTLSRINLGIRHRLAPLLDNNRKKMELMNILLFSLPGTPVIYYGDEIGMGDNHYLGDRNGVRTPMQWNDGRNAGFSDSNPQKLYLPVIIDPEYSYEAINVETQQKNPSSLFWWMKRVISMRKRFKAFGSGEIKFLNPSNAKVFAFIRIYKEEQILVITNLSRFCQAVELDLKEYSGWIPEEVFSQNKFPSVKETPYLFTLTPYGYYWFILKQVKEKTMLHEDYIPALQLKRWKDLFRDDILEKIEHTVLPFYLRKMRWFGGKARTMRNIRIIEKVFLPGKDISPALLIVEVIYYEGLSELYQLPVAAAFDEYADRIRKEFPQSVLSFIAVEDRKGVLFDAVYDEEFRLALLKMMAQKKKVKTGNGKLHFYTNAGVSKSAKEITFSKLLGAEQSNTSIQYGDQFFLKLYRKLDIALNPELEISNFLSGKVGFLHVSEFLGAIEKYQDDSTSMSLGILQALVPHYGDAWTHMQDVLKRYYEKILSHEDIKKIHEPKEEWSLQLNFEKLPGKTQDLLVITNVEHVRLLGQRTAELHLALASRPGEKGFEPEPFSLHYQRSLYASMQSLVRNSFGLLEEQIDLLTEDIRKEAREVLHMKDHILQFMKKIFDHKINTAKIRIHGDYHLGQILFTGNDFVIIDFEGEPARPLSERRLKRSPLTDVAGIIRSFHYVAYATLLKNESYKNGNTKYLEKWADKWCHYMSSFFLQHYLKTTKGASFIPDDDEDLHTLLQIFLLEKAVYELGYELNNRPGWSIIPIKSIRNIMKKTYKKEKEKTVYV